MGKSSEFLTDDYPLILFLTVYKGFAEFCWTIFTFKLLLVYIFFQRQLATALQRKFVEKSKKNKNTGIRILC